MKKKDAKGVLVSYVYDALNRLTMIDYPNTAEDIVYTYDSTADGNFGIGRMTGMTDASGATAFYYDEYGEVIKEVRTFTGLPALTTEYTYDSNGNKETMTYYDGRVVYYEYDYADKVSRVWSVKDGTTKDLANNITHKPFGPVSSYTYGNGLTALRTYDMDYRLTYLKSGPMLRRNYGYDNAGNITGISDLVHAEKNQAFVYDALNRLTSATGAYGTLEYEYDAVGSRTKKTANGAVTNYFYVPGTNKLDYATGAELATYTYDANGNMTSDGTYDYEYAPSGAPVPLVAGNPGVNPFIYTDSVGKPTGVQANLYNFVGNNPVNAIDPLGLSPKDVSSIYSTYYNSVEDMNQSGQRHWYPYWGNFDRTLYDLSNGNIGHKYLGCGEQEEYVKDKLERNTYDDTWTFEWQGSPLPPHQWLRAISNNPNDPIIVIDPWKDNIYNMPKR